MQDPYFTIRIDQTEKIHRTVQRLREQQEDLMEIQAKVSEGGSVTAITIGKLRLDVFDEVLTVLKCELGRLTLNRAAEAASKS